MNAILPPPRAELKPQTRDALAILAHLYMRFNRPAEAAALLGALTRLDSDPRWAQRTRCLALLQAGQHEAARLEASQLLEGPVDDVTRSQLLRILAKANWRLGRGDEARAFLAEALTVAATEVMGGPTRRTGE